jgi:hypothetical protein
MNIQLSTNTAFNGIRSDVTPHLAGGDPRYSPQPELHPFGGPMFGATLSRHSSKFHLAGVAIALGAMSIASHVNAATYPTPNLLTNDGFETNLLTSDANVLGPPFSQNIWGDEDSTITGATAGVTPHGGKLMLSMTTDNLVATQTFQLIDVSAYAADISAGNLTASASAFYNADQALPAAFAEINIFFWDSGENTTGPTNSTTAQTLDANPATWEQLSVNNVPIPTNTNFIIEQVIYGDASLNANDGALHAGFVDDATLTLNTVPEPTSLGLLAFGAVGFLRVRRQK